MTPSDFYKLRPGDVVSCGSLRATVVSAPVATRQGFKVELRAGKTRRFINPTTAANWSLDT